MKAVAAGRITVFPRDGAYQLYCDTLIPEGAGDLAVAFQQLKEKLWKEGLFDPAHKVPLPPYPERIAVVTSGAGAAVHDMIRNTPPPLSHRQGDPAARAGPGAGGTPEIAGAIRLRGPVEDRRRHHHRPGRRIHGGPVGLQRRAGGPGHLRLRDARHLRRGP